MRYPTRKTLSHFGLAFLMAAASACAGDSANKAKSPRALWLDNPSSGSQNGDVIKIPGLSVSFEKPATLYVFKDCQESSHSRNSEGLVPVLQCSPRAGGEGEGDEYSDDTSDFAGIMPMTFYVGPKNIVVNERTVETLKLQYQQQGWTVEEMGYYPDYVDKAKRSGIAMRVVLPETDDDAGTEIMRFIFPVNDIMFTVETRYPPGTDRSGMNFDWRRVIWNFQLDEDGPLSPGGNE